MARPLILLTPEQWRPLVNSAVESHELASLEDPDGAVLIAFLTEGEVPSDIFDRVARAYKFRAASPEYRGFEPHRWAAYADATEYGATAYITTERIPDGPIVGVNRFLVQQPARPAELLSMASMAAYELFRELASKMAERDLHPIGVRWSNRIWSGEDLESMCRVPPELGDEEIRRRERAFDGYDLSAT